MNGRYAFAGVLIIACVSGGIFWFKARQATHTAAVSGTDMKVQGPADAPIKIIEYSDFQCPACQRAGTTLAQFFAAYPGKIQLFFRHFPLSSHTWSPLAHQAAECASEAGHFWEYHDRLYSEQAIWSNLSNPTETFLKFAGDLNLDLDRFAACLTDQKIARRILEEKQQGESLQIKSTPTFFINGERVVGPIELQIRGENLIRQTLGLPLEPPPAFTADLAAVLQTPVHEK